MIWFLCLCYEVALRFYVLIFCLVRIENLEGGKSCFDSFLMKYSRSSFDVSGSTYYENGLFEGELLINLTLFTLRALLLVNIFVLLLIDGVKQVALYRDEL